jgi:hypothetical protein
LITGKNSVKGFLDALRNKTPFLTSENYRRLPDDAIQNGEVRISANISLQDVGGFGIGVSKFPKCTGWIFQVSRVCNDYISS